MLHVAAVGRAGGEGIGGGFDRQDDRRRGRQEIDVLGAKPSNLCFGGIDGRTVSVCEVDHGRLVNFRAVKPGLAWARLQKK